MEEFKLSFGDIKKINSYFPDDKPLFAVDGYKFKVASSDWKEQVKAKAIEMGYWK
ncbi:hypothetical protein QMA56_09570 [Leuconostoc falkenbergense]|uniref:hypothetical protein n=1 Tax=Leuconostoc falkenbergense TaxID=2766470 RepID=UPI0024AD7F12|nr:hypothetical protein [Leuconostoc falkenbergense]MDI6667951.1 hypothetical protein [Leuconostoc falkenbergense]